MSESRLMALATSIVAELSQLGINIGNNLKLLKSIDTRISDNASKLDEQSIAIDKLKLLTKNSDNSMIITHPLFGEGMNESGDCTFIGINGKWIIIDFLAKSTENQKSIQKRMDELGINKFDLAILSHYHNDHVGNLEWLLGSAYIAKLMLPDITKTEVTGTWGMPRSALDRIYRGIQDYAGLLDNPIETITPKTIDFHGAKLTFYNCSDEDYEYYRSVGNNDYNNLSVGLEINYLNRTAIFEGDCNYLAMERNALRNPTNVDYLKSNHHGISNVPLSYRKLNPRDLMMTTTQDIARSNLYVQNFQNTFQQMGSNIYLLGDQVEPPTITYKGDGSIEYNRKLIRDGTAGHATSLEIYVDRNYTGQLKTGDERSPFVYLADAVRFINQIKHASVTVNIKAGDYTRPEDKGSIHQPRKALVIQNVNNRVIFKRQGEGVVNLPPVIINCCKYVYFKDVEFIGVSADDNRKIRVYESSVVLDNVKADSQKDPSNNTSNIVIVGIQGLSLVKLANVNFTAGWGAINNNGGTVILEGTENHVATDHAYVLGVGDIYVHTPFVEKNNINKSGDSSAVELGNVYFRPVQLNTDIPRGLAKGTVIPVKNTDKPQEQSFIQANGKVWTDTVYSIVNPTTTTVPDYTGQVGINGENVSIGSNGKWVDLTNASSGKDKKLTITHPLFGYNNGESGDCTFVGVDSNWFIVDSYEKSDAHLKSILKTMTDNNIDKFEFGFLSHYHGDHYGNFVELINRGKISKMYIPDASKQVFTGRFAMTADVLNLMSNEIKQACTNKGIPFEIITPKTIDFHGAKLTFYNCSDDDYNYYKSVGNDDYNNLSACIEINYLNRVALLEGDSLYEAMEHNAMRNPVNVDYLKSNHHGISQVPLSYRKVNPRDIVVTASKAYSKELLFSENYQATFTQMGCNLYLLGDQVAPPKITYYGDGSIEYNRELLRDGTAGQATTLVIYVDRNYTGELKTGDKHTPFTHFADAIRFVSNTKYTAVTVRIASGDYTRPEDVGVSYKNRSLAFLKNISTRVTFVTEGTDPANLPPLLIELCNGITFRNINFLGPSDNDNKKIKIYDSNVHLQNCKLDSIKRAPTNSGVESAIITQGDCNVRLTNVSFIKGWAAIHVEGGTVLLTGTENHCSTDHAYVLNNGFILVDTPFVEKNNVNKFNDSAAHEVGKVYFKPVTSVDNLPRDLLPGTSVPAKNREFPQINQFIATSTTPLTDYVYSIVDITKVTTPRFTGQLGYKGEQVFFGINNKWVELTNPSK